MTSRAKSNQTAAISTVSRTGRALAVLSLLMMALIPVSCSKAQQQTSMTTDKSEPQVIRAIAVLNPTEGNDVFGTVDFTKESDGIHVVADVSGLTPGKHGFHIHDKGDCSASDGSSAGGHFAPDGHKHGAPTDTDRHVGDLGNIVADATGHAHFEWTDTVISFSGPHSIIGRGVIVHAGEDDLKSQPSGNAGARVACGVIGIAETAPASSTATR